MERTNEPTPRNDPKYIRPRAWAHAADALVRGGESLDVLIPVLEERKGTRVRFGLALALYMYLRLPSEVKAAMAGEFLKWEESDRPLDGLSRMTMKPYGRGADRLPPER